ncbi:MAG: bifunctional 4-hydroxy-2-oxoglutarate aldolase/2-dehydro-3-deoxy-phosphogluconate aldolase [Ruminococcaceae bacterium]|nr:bifunctional 4-hydroxy-2-oxoglutarate aldolase/2-dehydro-3-deoxy-phosphogluconate aldolase [Oscillospiraceae bacterium]
MKKINNHEKTGILPVINIPNVSLAIPVAEALRQGGVNAIEVTLRSSDSLESIKSIKSAFPDMTVGAGTVLNVQAVDSAIKNGADFIVSPGYDDEVVNYCISRGIKIVPGCTTPSEIQKAVKLGLGVLKFFPAELNGGIDAINLLSGPFPDVKFIPTGGINFNNLGTYLSNKKVLACGGSYMATSEQIKNGDFDSIAEACKKALDISLGFELAHIGINCNSNDEASFTAQTISKIFRLTPRDLNSAVFAGNAVEAVKYQGRGANGHIGFYTNSIRRAAAYFESQGFELDEANTKYKNNQAICIYLKDEIGGFALHAVER